MESLTINESIKVFGLDFTSAPSKSKPLVFVHGYGTSRSNLFIFKLELWSNFINFEKFLSQKGPWVAGFDFPFGLPIDFLKKNKLSLNWNKYVNYLGKYTKNELEQKIKTFKDAQPYGQKDLNRITDSMNKARSPLKIINPPLIKMFYEGAKRLANSGITVIPFHLPHDNRIVFETYPALLSRLYTGSYKSNRTIERNKNLRMSRQKILDGILSQHLTKTLSFSIDLKEDIKKKILDDNTGDTLDSILCCIQAYWSYLQGWPYFRINSKDLITIKSEGWIVSPNLPNLT